MRARPSVWLVLVSSLVIASAFRPGIAGVMSKDPGTDAIQFNPLLRIVDPTCPTCTSLAPSSVASPFVSRAFNTSTSSMLLSDLLDDGTQMYAVWPDSNSGLPHPVVQSTDWILIQFDFRLTGAGTDWAKGQFWAGNPGNAAVKLSVSGSDFVITGRRDSAGSATDIQFSGVTAIPNEWYHVEVLVNPFSFGPSGASNDRTFAITITQWAGGARPSGSLHHVLYEATAPMSEIGFGNLVNGHTVHGIYFDNFAVETLPGTPAPEVVKDSCDEVHLNQLIKIGNDGTYSCASGQNSTIPSNRFPTITSGGDLNDKNANAKPRLRQTTTPMGNAAKDWIHAQFDFKFSDTTSMDEWSFIFANNSNALAQGSPTSPNAFELRVQSGQLTLYGRSATTGTLAYVPIGMTAQANTWYRADIIFRPAYLAASERSYTVGITKGTGMSANPIAMTLLNEDPTVITDFNVLTNVTTKTGHVYIDNVIVEPLHHLDNELRYGYYPTANKIRAFIKSAPYWAATWRFDLIVASTGVSLANWTGSFPFNIAGETLQSFPVLTNGTDYKLRLTLSSGVSGDPTVIVDDKLFTHRDFSWETEQLGTDNTIVVPPFTALDAIGNTVSAVQRTHTIGAAGLWSQVEVTDNVGIHPLLSGPATLHLVNSGSPSTASGGAPSFTLQQPYQVTGTSTWSAGPLNGTTSFDYDYDGLTKFTLNLGTVPTTVSSMYIDIPLNASEAKYMKVVTDNFPNWDTPGHLAQSIPSATGTVWTSANVFRVELPGPFVPYIWIGGEERGVLFIAENDKDWSLDATTPVLELIRSTNDVTLRIKLFTTAPPTLRSRTITFALMATPAKPMPTLPRNWRNWKMFVPVIQTIPNPPQRLTFDFMSDSGYNHGSQTEAMSKYPAFQNYGLYDQLAKVRIGGISTVGYVDNRLSTMFSGLLYNGDPYGSAPLDVDHVSNCPPPDYKCIRHGMRLSLNNALDTKATQIRHFEPIQNVVIDGFDGGTTLPLVYFENGDPANNWNPLDTVSPSPFVTSEFTSTTNDGLMTDNSSTTTPYLESPSLGIAGTDWVRLAFDVRIGTASGWQWNYLLGEEFSSPFAFDIGVQGSQFRVNGRRKLSDTVTGIFVPNVVWTAGTWYHVEAILKPSSYAAADRTYDVSVSSRNADGTWTTGRLAGILIEDSNPVDRFWVRNMQYGQSGTGSTAVDNVIVSKVKPAYLFTYTNARGAAWDQGTFNETATYIDEWSIYDPADPRWDSVKSDTGHFLRRMFRENAGGYDEFTGTASELEPVPSYVNMALHYTARMYDTFLDGIYLDNYYLRVSYNPVTGPGYVSVDDLKLHPGISFYTLRNYAKRTMIDQYQRGMRPNIWIHMSNNHIVPIDSFGTINYDYEWVGPYATDPDFVPPNQNGPLTHWDVDKQTAFGLDNDTGYVFAQSTGQQSGNIGLMIDESFHALPANQDHLLRSELAVALVHEFKAGLWQPPAEHAVHALESFGYGDPKCDVYRYWDPTAQPVGATAANVKLLVLNYPNDQSTRKAFIVVSSFQPTDASVHLTIDPSTLHLPTGYQWFDDTDGLDTFGETVTGNAIDVTVKGHEYKLIRLE